MKEKKITEKTFVRTAIVGSILIILILTTNMVWSSWLTIKATDDAVAAVSSFYLEAMADRRAQTITNLIDNNFTYMEKAVEVMQDGSITSQEELRLAIGDIKSLLSLNRFALVDEDNTVYTQYTTYSDGSRHDFLAKDKMNPREISTVYLYGSSKQLCLAIPMDFTIIGKKIKACFVQIDITDIVELLAFDDDGKTNFGLFSRSGENLSETELGPVVGNQNFLDTIHGYLTADEWDKLCNDFANDKAGSLTFVSGDSEETICYVPVPDTGWELVVLIRGSVIRDQIQEISDKNIAVSRHQISLTFFMMLVFAIVLFLQFRRIARDKLDAEQKKNQSLHSMANTDSMTGVKNKHAFLEAEASINQKIRENEIEKLAVLVLDINGLKYVNDNFGHAAGDQLIKDAGAMISEYFTHSNVYRIGGDEFVVLMQGKGYDKLDEVMEEFNKKMEDNIQEGAVVISLGHSSLQPEDENLHDVFERADQMMYERKKALKAMGAKTRE